MRDPRRPRHRPHVSDRAAAPQAGRSQRRTLSPRSWPCHSSRSASTRSSRTRSMTRTRASPSWLGSSPSLAARDRSTPRPLAPRRCAPQPAIAHQANIGGPYLVSALGLLAAASHPTADSTQRIPLVSRRFDGRLGIELLGLQLVVGMDSFVRGIWTFAMERPRDERRTAPRIRGSAGDLARRAHRHPRRPSRDPSRLGSEGCLPSGACAYRSSRASSRRQCSRAFRRCSRRCSSPQPVLAAARTLHAIGGCASTSRSRWSSR